MHAAYLGLAIVLAALAVFSGIGKLRRDPKIVYIVHNVVGVPLIESHTMAIPTWKGDHDSVIQVLVAENPKKLGSKAFKRFALYRSDMTVREYIERCKSAPRPNDALIDLTWDSEHGFIRIDPPLLRHST